MTARVEFDCAWCGRPKIVVATAKRCQAASFCSRSCVAAAFHCADFRPILTPRRITEIPRGYDRNREMDRLNDEAMGRYWEKVKDPTYYTTMRIYSSTPLSGGA